MFGIDLLYRVLYICGMNTRTKRYATVWFLTQWDDVLMMHRNTNPNDFQAWKYNGIGGKCREWERMDSCIVRECEEETWLTPTAFEMIWVLDQPWMSPWSDRIIAVYMISQRTWSLLSETREGTLMRIPQGKILNQPLWPADYYRMPHCFKWEHFISYCEFTETGAVLPPKITLVAWQQNLYQRVDKKITDQ